MLDFRADKLDNLYLFTTEAKAYGGYFVNILESSIEVTSYNILDDSITTKTYQTEDIKYIAGRNIKVVDNNGDIYLQIKGRNTANGAKAKFLMHLNTGDNSSNFAKDNRTVSTFIRIN